MKYAAYMLLYLGRFMDTGLAVISEFRLYDFKISASWNSQYYRISNFNYQLYLFSISFMLGKLFLLLVLVPYMISIVISVVRSFYMDTC